MQSIDDLANVITDLEPTEQQALLDKVAQMNFEKACTISPGSIARV